jgi:hypothetical protein
MAKEKETGEEIVAAPIYMEAAPFPAPPVIKHETE